MFGTAFAIPYIKSVPCPWSVVVVVAVRSVGRAVVRAVAGAVRAVVGRSVPGSRARARARYIRTNRQCKNNLKINKQNT